MSASGFHKTHKIVLESAADLQLCAVDCIFTASMKLALQGQKSTAMQGVGAAEFCVFLFYFSINKHTSEFTKNEAWNN